MDSRRGADAEASPNKMREKECGLVGWLVGWWVGWLVGGWVDWLVGGLVVVGWLVVVDWLGYLFTG